MRRARVVAAIPIALVLAGCPLALDDRFRVEGDAAIDASDSGTREEVSTDAPIEATPCEGGFVCGGKCVDTRVDPANCGSCGRACVKGHACGAGACAPWIPVAAPPMAIAAREKAAACALSDGRVFVWGGADAVGVPLATGALYDPANDGWMALPAAPIGGRVLATAVCVPNYVVVWGGGDPLATADYKDGAIYDVIKNTWTIAASPPGALSARRMPYGANVSGAASFFGGIQKNGSAMAGAPCALDPKTNTWTQAGGGGPGALLAPAVDVGQDVIWVFAGQAGANETADLWSLAAGTWSLSNAGGAPGMRLGAFGAWDGARFVIWGGKSANAPLQSGGVFTTPSGPWKGMASAMSPSARSVDPRRSGVAIGVGGARTLMLGGIAQSGVARDGAIYDALKDAWTPVPAWTLQEDHEWGVSVWTGTELFVWGGRTAAALSSKGERFAP